jgi:1-aminocyclopropane-1-carboxylate deaminase
MQDIGFQFITTDKLALPILEEKKLSADVLRLDKIHPLISGNKFFKLRYYLEEATQTGKTTIATFGGAWSNHILATAAACQLHGFKSLAYIRGEEISTLSPTLSEAKKLGMKLIFLSRDEYQKKKRDCSDTNTESYIIHEGGFGVTGAAGAATILSHCKKEDYTHICCAAGTGTMTAGLLIGAGSTQQVISCSVLKNNTQLKADILSLTEKNSGNLMLVEDYHFGGYAKYTDTLIAFMNMFYTHTNIPSDFVYTGKLFFGIHNLITHHFFPPGSKLLIIHSGGLQGNISLNKGTLIF